MRTVTLKFVVENDELSIIEGSISEALEVPLNPYTLYAWTQRKSNKSEVKFKQKEDSQR